MPDELKGKDEIQGEASMKGHLKNGDDELHGSQAYVPADTSKDTQLAAALDILRGVKKAANTPAPAPAAPAPLCAVAVCGGSPGGDSGRPQGRSELIARAVRSTDRASAPMLRLGQI